MVNNVRFNNHLLKACLVAVITIGLAACSSSDSGTSTDPSPSAAEAEATAITNAIAAAKTAVDGLTAGSSDAAVAAANTAITAAQNAIAGAEHASAADTVANLAALDAIRDSLTTAQTAIDDHRADLAQQRQAAIDAQIKEVGTKLMAMNREAGTDGSGGFPTDTAAAFSRDRDGTMVTVTDNAGNTDDEDDVTYMSSDLGGGTTMHVREADADNDGNVVTQISVITTDIEAPTATPFDDVYTLDVNTNTENDDPAVTNEAHAIDETNGEVRARVMSGAFTAGTGAELTFASDDGGTDDMDEAFETTGTYDGATGTYRCNGAADCTVTLNADGMITAMSDGWIFTPNDDVTVDVPDAEYLHYGFWLQKTADADGVVTYDQVETFADSTLDRSGSTSAVLGTATYTGGATGVYVRHVYTEGGGSIAASSAGHFTADASLTANFGGSDVAVNDQQRLTGTIDNFMLSGGESNDWSVALQSDRDAAAEGIQPDDDGVLSGTAMGGGRIGSFNAIYHGTVDANTQPGAVVGEFNAGFSNGAVAGAFGAIRAE